MTDRERIELLELAVRNLQNVAGATSLHLALVTAAQEAGQKIDVRSMLRVLDGLERFRTARGDLHGIEVIHCLRDQLRSLREGEGVAPLLRLVRDDEGL